MKGWGPLIPLGTTRGSEYTQGSSQRGLPIALCTSDCRHFLAFRDMRSDVQYVVGHKQQQKDVCAALHAVALCVTVYASSSSDVTSVLPRLFTFVHFW